MNSTTTFKEFIAEAKAKKLVVKAKKHGNLWTITNNILPRISVEVWNNHDEIDDDGDYMATGGQQWGYDTPYDFKKFTGYDNVKELNVPKDIWQFGTDLGQGYLDWRKNETKYIISAITKSLEWYLKAWMDQNGIAYQNNYNKFYLYYRPENTVYMAAKTKSAKWIKNLENYGIPKFPESYGNMEVISYEEAGELKATNLDKLK
jgi:hypothetical protein